MKVSHDRRSPYPLLVDALCLLPGTLAQLEEVFLYNEHGGPRVSPEGAAFLLDLFRRGAFDASDGREVEGGLELLTPVFQRPRHNHRPSVRDEGSSAALASYCQERKAKRSRPGHGLNCTPSCAVRCHRAPADLIPVPPSLARIA